MKTYLTYIIVGITATLLFACAKQPRFDQYEQPPIVQEQKKVGHLKYAIQVGAFSNIDNALRLTDNLNRKGLQAYYFVHESGLYKVRFGDYETYQEALAEAKELYEIAQISDYYIVKPEDFSVAQQPEKGTDFVREQLVTTAERFLGIPYKWGGASLALGFDCSGLSMVVYKINGMDLPRNSLAQFKAGQKIDLDGLGRGDLVFFATNGGRRVSHVGIYKGEGQFIHAPKRGKKIEIASLKTGYFREHFIGAKTYL